MYITIYDEDNLLRDSQVIAKLKFFNRLSTLNGQVIIDLDPKYFKMYIDLINGDDIKINNNNREGLEDIADYLDSEKLRNAIKFKFNIKNNIPKENAQYTLYSIIKDSLNDLIPSEPEIEMSNEAKRQNDIIIKHLKMMSYELGDDFIQNIEDNLKPTIIYEIYYRKFYRNIANDKKYKDINMSNLLYQLSPSQLKELVEADDKIGTILMEKYIKEKGNPPSSRMMSPVRRNVEFTHNDEFYL